MIEMIVFACLVGGSTDFMPGIPCRNGLRPAKLHAGLAADGRQVVGSAPVLARAEDLVPAAGAASLTNAMSSGSGTWFSESVLDLTQGMGTLF